VQAVFYKSSLITLGQKVFEKIWTLLTYVLYAGCTGNIFLIHLRKIWAEDCLVHISMIMFIIPEMIVMISADCTGSLFFLLKMKNRIWWSRGRKRWA
jgi:hypothetical protein